MEDAFASSMSVLIVMSLIAGTALVCSEGGLVHTVPPMLDSSIGKTCTPEQAERCALTPGCTKCDEPAGGLLEAIGMSNFRNKISAVDAYVIENNAKSGKDIWAWNPATCTDCSAWAGVGGVEEIILMEHATAFPADDTCAPIPGRPPRDGCHPAFPTTEEMVTAEVDAYGHILDMARSVWPQAHTFLIYNRTHNFCDTDGQQQNPEPYAAAVTETVAKVAALHPDVIVGTNLHEATLFYNNPSGDPATVDCSLFARDGTHPSPLGAAFVADLIESDLALIIP